MHAMPGPAFVAAIVDVTPADDRSRAFNLQFWAFNLGMAVGVGLAGALAEVSFTLLFAVDATGTLVTALLILWKVRETRPAHRGATNSRAGCTRRSPTARTCSSSGCQLLLAIVSMQSSTILPLAITADGLRPAGVRLRGRLRGAAHRRRPAVRAEASSAAGARAPPSPSPTCSSGSGSPRVALADGVAGLPARRDRVDRRLDVAAPPNAAVIAELSPEALRGRYQSVFYLIFPAASFIAPAAGGASLEFLGDWHWVICGRPGRLAAAGHLLIQPARERRVSRQRERLRSPRARVDAALRRDRGRSGRSVGEVGGAGCRHGRHPARRRARPRHPGPDGPGGAGGPAHLPPRHAGPGPGRRVGARLGRHRRAGQLLEAGRRITAAC